MFIVSLDFQTIATNHCFEYINFIFVNLQRVADIFSFKVSKKSLSFSKHCIFTMAASILTNLENCLNQMIVYLNLAGNSLNHWFSYSILTLEQSPIL